MKTNGGSIFLSGIGGSGMSALACLLMDRGIKVAGSDRAFDDSPGGEIEGILRTRGVEIVQQDGSRPLKDDSLMVMSAAVEDDRPEVQTAKRLGLPIKQRGEFLAELTGEFRTLAIAGTSGKSTTSAMLAFVMDRLGLDPVYIGGGRLREFKSADNAGNYRKGNSDILVVEACESDGFLSAYKAEHSVVLNIDLDHMGIEKTLELFNALAANTKDTMIVNADDQGLDALKADKKIGFSIKNASEFRAEDISLSAFGSSFIVNGISIELNMPGLHNIYNALATLSMLSLFDLSLSAVAEALSEFRGIERRFDIHLNELDHSDRGGALVIDDYAHNPHKISYLMDTMKEIAPQVNYVFQPHGFGPAILMREEYVRVFKENLRPGDRLSILPIFFAGGSARKDISSQDIANEIGPGASAPACREDIINTLEAGKGVFVVFGARDDSLSELASEIARKISLRRS
jgi:UDP-N-acetylmuramate--alanine ligase